MRLLANENFPGAAVAALRNAGHDVLWVRTESPGATDRAVLHAAQSQERILLTFDKDFGELAFRSNLPAQSGIILFRLRQRDRDCRFGKSPPMARILLDGGRRTNQNEATSSSVRLLSDRERLGFLKIPSGLKSLNLSA